MFEDGWLESNPWRYFFFKGLCLQAIYTMRSGLPAVAYKGFGEIVSPNVIMPDWIMDGVCHLLYSRYCEQCARAPLNDAILRSAPVPDLDEVSNHPENWPGPSSFRVFGRPFIRWVAERTGWERMHGFFFEHGRGIIPIEIDWKAKQHLGYTWAELWEMYKKERLQSEIEDRGINISGYWKEPFVYWNRTGVYPGVRKSGYRSRYGFLDENHSLWLSQYDNKGISKLVCYKGGQPVWVENMHIWDPGVGSVAVSRTGHQPQLVIFSSDSADLVSTERISAHARFERIPGPDGVIQLSGPVMDSKGRIFVAGNSNGNWDIWLYEGNWQRITDGPATEIDPWIERDVLLYASNKDGSFKIRDLSGTISSDCKTMALLPRKGHYLCLSGNGWVVSELLSEPYIEGYVDSLISTDHLKK